jgi:hypothetical protein
MQKLIWTKEIQGDVTKIYHCKPYPFLTISISKRTSTMGGTARYTSYGGIGKHLSRRQKCRHYNIYINGTCVNTRLKLQTAKDFIEKYFNPFAKLSEQAVKNNNNNSLTIFSLLIEKLSEGRIKCLT